MGQATGVLLREDLNPVTPCPEHPGGRQVFRLRVDLARLPRAPVAGGPVAYSARHVPVTAARPRGNPDPGKLFTVNGLCVDRGPFGHPTSLFTP